jgi:hypothetical protein
MQHVQKTYLSLGLAGSAALVVLLGFPDASHQRTAYWVLFGLMAASFGLAGIFRTKPSISNTLDFITQTLAFACLALWSAALLENVANKVLHAWQCQLHSPFMDEIMEGREAAKSWLSSQGIRIYTDLKEYPLLITFYGPLYYLFSGWAVGLTGSGMQAARLVSACATILLLVVMAGIVRKRTESLAAGLACSLLALASPTMVYGAYARPDMLALLFLMSATYCLLVYETDTRWPNAAFWTAAICLCGAAFTKQQTWAYIGAAVLYFWWRRPTRKKALRLTLVLALLGGVSFAAAQVLTGGEYLRQSVLYARLLPSFESYNSFSSAASRTMEFLQVHWGLVLVFAASIVSRRGRPVGLLDVMFVFGLFSLVSILRWWGSSVNHFIPLMLFMILEAGSFLVLLGRKRLWAGLALCAGLLLLPRFGVSVPSGDNPCHQNAERDGYIRALAKLESLPGPVAMDVEGAYLFLDGPAAAKIKLYDAFETDFYDQGGMWNLLDSRLAQDIRARRLSAFVDTQVFMSSKLSGLVRRYYSLDETLGRYSFFLPRKDMSILTFPCLEGQKSQDGPSRIDAAELNGLKNWGSYLQPQEESTPGSLTLRIASDEIMGNTTLTLFPRLTAQGQTISLSWSEDGHSFKPLAQWAFQGPPPGTGWENRQEVSFTPSSRSISVRITLTGAAQLWLSQASPLTAHIQKPK